ncbi:MAG: FG-GAP repeat domain-containing protein, partial [Sphingobacteriales bacterium]
LLPHMLSTEGPALAVGDLNNDGMDDVFVGGARGKKAGLFVQRADGVFVPWQSEVLNADSLYEDVDAIWNDVNSDGWKDLVVVSGGNEYYGADSLKWPRVYLNQEGKSFTKTNIKGVASTLSCVVPMDVNNDGKTDLFFGGRAITFAYGTVPSSYLMQNDGRGGFRDVTAGSVPGLEQIGFVKGATSTDLDGDKDQDLVLALEWGGVVAFIKDGAVFRQQTLLPTKGWWSFVKATDLDGDGDVDLVVGNQGENSRVRPTLQEPVRMYYDDFDGNGLKEQFITYYLRGEEIPFANKSELDKQMPGLKKRFLYAEQFAKSPVDKIIDRALLNKAPVFTAETFSNAILINEGGLRFRLQPMPAMAQLSNYNDALITDLNKDGKPDVVLAGNFDADVIALGRNDADHGSLLINGGSGNFSYQQMNGVSVRGVSKKIREITVSGKRYLLIARNNETLLAISY